MAFQAPNARELANRKILEELQLKKQMLLKQGAVPNLSSTAITPSIPVVAPPTIPAGVAPDVHMMSSTQRTAIINAHNQSFGFFVPQDSSFGNLILPVLPRFDNK